MSLVVSLSVDLTGADGSLYSAAFRDQGSEFRVTSFSACFELDGKRSG